MSSSYSSSWSASSRSWTLWQRPISTCLATWAVLLLGLQLQFYFWGALASTTKSSKLFSPHLAFKRSSNLHQSMVRRYSNKALMIDWSCQIVQSFWFQFFLLSSYNSAYSQQAQQVAVAFKAIPNYSDSSDDCCHVSQTFVCVRKRCVW